MNRVVFRDAPIKGLCAFRDPIRLIEARSIGEVIPALQEVEALVEEKGLYAAGCISYEAAPAFDSALEVHPPVEFPLMWFGIYEEMHVIEEPDAGSAPTLPMLDWQPSVDTETYRSRIDAIRAYLANGETYQVNYTMRLTAPFTGDPWGFFLSLLQAGQSDYAAYVDTGRFALCSASPELFFELDGETIRARPMKGTAPRGLSAEEDERLSAALFTSEKNRAENLMITDMIRNDIGRIAKPGTVKVPALFSLERYPTLWQMTSTVEAVTDSSITGIMKALFPCASITGAPKVKTMQIIAELEDTPRQIYTGCIGYLAPGRKACFSVAIRTVQIDRHLESAQYGVGGGIVWDSDVHDEYKECMLKACVLSRPREEFSLLETILWTPGRGYFLLEYHLERLCSSARYFGFSHDRDEIRTLLEQWQRSFGDSSLKIRLFLDRWGHVSHEVSAVRDTTMNRRLRLRPANGPVPVGSPFLYHKTTNRSMYNRLLEGCGDCDDVLLWNERGEITETSIANIVVDIGGRLYTPPVECGLLPGTFRAMLLEDGIISERVILLSELAGCRHIYLINSVRKWQAAELVESHKIRMQ